MSIKKAINKFQTMIQQESIQCEICKRMLEYKTTSNLSELDSTNHVTFHKFRNPTQSFAVGKPICDNCTLQIPPNALCYQCGTHKVNHPLHTFVVNFIYFNNMTSMNYHCSAACYQVSKNEAYSDAKLGKIYQQCHNCLEWRETCMRCSRCHKAYYCGKSCQKQHWSTHKPNCTKIVTEPQTEKVVTTNFAFDREVYSNIVHEPPHEAKLELDFETTDNPSSGR